MTRTVLLGTAGGPAPKAARSAPAQCLLVGDDAYVIDCGNGVARQMVLAGVPLASLRATFITHHHSDHNADLGNLMLLAWAANLDRTVELYGPPPTTEIWRLFLAMNRPDIDIRVGDEGRRPLDELGRATDIAAAGLVYEDDNVRVTCALVDHPPFEVALGYRFDTAEKSVVISGDTAFCPALIELARGADVLIHEAMHVPSLATMAARDNGTALLDHLKASHTSVEDVGRVAHQAGVGTLVLSHLVPSDLPVSDDQWRAGAAQHFGGKILVGHDLMVIE